MTAIRRVTLLCDLCPEKFGAGYLTVRTTRRYARENGWRLTLFFRDVCPVHPKLKGSR